MINTILLSLLLGPLSSVNHGRVFQAKEPKLFFTLSGPDIFEGHYKPVAYFTLYRFDDKCKLHQQDKIKLNKKTTQAEAPYIILWRKEQPIEGQIISDPINFSSDYTGNDKKFAGSMFIQTV